MTDSSATGLPESIEAAWGVRSRPGYGPKPGLSIQRIVDTAIGVAATEGMAAVSMVRVGRELGVSTMALYRHVAAKQELIDLMVDTGIGPPPPDNPEANWRQRLSGWADGYLAMLRRAPWVLQAPATGLPITPHQIAWLESGLARMRDLNITEEQKLSTVWLLIGVMRNWASMTFGMRPSDDNGPNLPFATTLSKLIDEERFPAVSAAISSGAINDDYDGSDDCAMEIELLLDGVEVRARKNSGHNA